MAPAGKCRELQWLPVTARVDRGHLGTLAPSPNFWDPHRIRVRMRLRTNAGDGITPIGIAGVRDSANLKNIGRPGDQALN